MQGKGKPLLSNQLYILPHLGFMLPRCATAARLYVIFNRLLQVSIGVTGLDPVDTARGHFSTLAQVRTVLLQGVNLPCLRGDSDSIIKASNTSSCPLVLQLTLQLAVQCPVAAVAAVTGGTRFSGIVAGTAAMGHHTSGRRQLQQFPTHPATPAT